MRVRATVKSGEQGNKVAPLLFGLDRRRSVASRGSGGETRSTGAWRTGGWRLAASSAACAEVRPAAQPANSRKPTAFITGRREIETPSRPRPPPHRPRRPPPWLPDGVASGVKRRARRHRAHAAPGAGQARTGGGLPVAQRPAGRPRHGQSAGQAAADRPPRSAPPPGSTPARRQRSPPRPVGVQLLGGGRDLARRGRHLGQALGQGAKIQAGAADDDRVAAHARPSRTARRSPRPASGPQTSRPRRRRRRTDDGAPRLSAAYGRGAEDSQIAIELQGVGIDDLAAGRPRQPRASADLPLAVGPAISVITARCSSHRPIGRGRPSPVLLHRSTPASWLIGRK